MKSYLKILIGNVLLTGAYTFLTVPNNIINGGVTSTSLLISHYLNIDIGYISTAITLFLLLFGLITLGKKIFLLNQLSAVFAMLFFLTYFIKSPFR